MGIKTFSFSIQLINYDLLIFKCLLSKKILLDEWLPIKPSGTLPFQMFLPGDFM